MNMMNTSTKLDETAGSKSCCNLPDPCFYFEHGE